MQNPVNGDTALLMAARSDRSGSTIWLQVLLEHGANHLANNFQGRGLVHLTLRQDVHFDYHSARALKAKLVCLIRAGCCIHAVDDLGQTAIDLARSPYLRKTWKRALDEVGMLNDQSLDLLYKEVRYIFQFSFPPCMRRRQNAPGY